MQIETMLDAVEPLVISITRRKLKGWPATIIDDIRQEIRIGLWQKSLSRYDPARGSLKSFAGQAISNLLFTAIRRLQADRQFQFTAAEIDDIAADAEPDDDDTTAKMKVVNDALADMRPADATLVRDLLAGGPGITSTSRYTRKSRVLKRLRAIVKSRTDRPAA